MAVLLDFTKFRPAGSADFADSAGRYTGACTNRFIHQLPLPEALAPYSGLVAASCLAPASCSAAAGGSGASAPSGAATRRVAAAAASGKGACDGPGGGGGN